MILEANDKSLKEGISEKLYKLVEEARPKGQKKVSFQQLGVYPLTHYGDGEEMTRTVGGVKDVPTQSIIYDPYAKKSVVLRLIESREPDPVDGSKTRINLSKIQFSAYDRAGRMDFSDDTSTMDQFDYLFLSGFNKANKGKPWYRAERRGFIYELLQPVQKAQSKIEREEKAAEAILAIKEWKDEQVIRVAKGIAIHDPQRMLAGIENVEYAEAMRADLMEFAHHHPNVILRADTDTQMKALAMVRDLIDTGIVKKDRNKFLWSDSNTLIVNVPVGQEHYVFLAKHLIKPEYKELKEQFQKLLEEKLSEDIAT